MIFSVIIGPLGAQQSEATAERVERSEREVRANAHDKGRNHIVSSSGGHSDATRDIYVTYEVTAYTANAESTGKSPGDPAYGITASGEPVKAGVTIACPPSMAFGTRLDIEGVGVRTCTDRGGAITEGRLDVYMPDLAEALAFGRQNLNVRIEEESE
jgi:3D (Asp-Asp-Asp) domain-containing protein